MRLQLDNHKNSFGLLVLLFIVATTSCKKLVDVDAPVTSSSIQSVYKDDATAIAVLTGIYSQISKTGFNSTSGLTTLSKKAGLSADELNLWSGASNYDKLFFQNSLGPNNTGSGGTVLSTGYEFWTTCYYYIYICNSAIEGLNSSTALSASVKQQLLGESKFLRAFFYFYLVNLYGDAPLVLTSDYKVNNALPRVSKSIIYEQITKDLIEAEQLLSDAFLNAQLVSYSGTPERVRPTLWAAKALLARVYLYTGKYNNAELLAADVINRSSMFELNTLDNVFLANSTEAIWQLQPVNKSGALFWNVEDARLFSLTASPVGLSLNKPVFLSSYLLNAFEFGDERKTSWVGSYTNATGTYFFPSKYKIATSSSTVSEYLMVLRLAEQYLIRAEARAHQNNIDGAKEDLNAIRARAGLSPTSANDKSSLLDSIQHERQVELFTELGHRWLDLKRTGNVDAVMSVVTPSKIGAGTWESYKQFYPLPASDLQSNPNLIQNIGY